MLIKLQELIDRELLPADAVRGVFHVGAHHCEERQDYIEVLRLSDTKVVWCEADPNTAQQARTKFPTAQVYSVLLADESHKQVNFLVTNNGESSSMLELDEHKKEHPYVYETGRLALTTTTMKDFVKDILKIENVAELAEEINFLNVDVQGAELLVLKGAQEYLKAFDYLYLEVNSKSLYKGCALLPELEAFLTQQGYEQKIIRMTPHGWGDAFYVKRPIPVNVEVEEVKVEPTTTIFQKQRKIICLSNQVQYSMLCNMLRTAVTDAQVPMEQFDITFVNDIPRDSDYYSQNYRFLTFYKLKLVLNKLKSLPNENDELLWVDNDIVFFKPFWNEMDAAIQKNPNVDFLLQNDGWAPCTGFWWMRKNKRTIKYVQRCWDWLRVQPFFQPGLTPAVYDQDAFSQVLNEQRQGKISVEDHCKVVLVNDDLFPNGQRYFDQKRTQTAVMVHNNFIVGTQPKIDRFQQYGLWQPDEDVFITLKDFGLVTEIDLLGHAVQLGLSPSSSSSLPTRTPPNAIPVFAPKGPEYDGFVNNTLSAQLVTKNLWLVKDFVTANVLTQIDRDLPAMQECWWVEIGILSGAPKFVIDTSVAAKYRNVFNAAFEAHKNTSANFHEMSLHVTGCGCVACCLANTFASPTVCGILGTLLMKPITKMIDTKLTRYHRHQFYSAPLPTKSTYGFWLVLNDNLESLQFEPSKTSIQLARNTLIIFDADVHHPILSFVDHPVSSQPPCLIVQGYFSV
jgi:FkbM family methyltransferase